MKNFKNKQELSPVKDVFLGEDQETVELMKNGDHKAFRKLYDKYKGPIMTYLNGFVRDQKTAEDLTQEVFIKVYRFSRSIDSKSKFTPWLWAIARNTALDRLRKKTESLSLTEENFTEDNYVDPSDSAEIQLIKQAKESEIQGCMDELTDIQREAVILRTVSSLSYDEIAIQMNATLSAIKSLVNRAKASLVQCMGRSKNV
jgi:RNA polymerase sigma-70 factor (ECF subfamily)